MSWRTANAGRRLGDFEISSAPVFCSVMFQRGLSRFAKPTGSFDSQMRMVESWVFGRMVNECD